MNKNQRYAAVGLTAGLLGGGAAGLVLATPGFSSAAGGGSVDVVQQEDVDTTDPTDTTDTTDATTEDTTDTTDETAGTTDTTDDTTDDTTTEDTTDTTDTTTDEASDMVARLRETLQPLVDDGTLTAAQADAVAEHLVANRPERGPHDGMGRGHHGGGPGGFGGDFGGGFDGEVVAGIIGIDADALREQLRAGSSIAEIAEANGVDPQVVIDALVAEAAAHLALSVENGRLTQAEADERLADLTERITERVNTAPTFGAPDEPGD